MLSSQIGKNNIKTILNRFSKIITYWKMDLFEGNLCMKISEQIIKLIACVFEHKAINISAAVINNLFLTWTKIKTARNVVNSIMKLGIKKLHVKNTQTQFSNYKTSASYT